MGPGFIARLPVGKFHGVGPATAAKMKSLGIHTGRDLRECELAFLVKTFGKAGRFYYWIARGVDERPVRPNRVRKSIGAETTFLEDLTEFEGMRAALVELAAKVWRHCETANTQGKTVTLKVKYFDFQTLMRSRTLADPIKDEAALAAISIGLLVRLAPAKGVRLLGVTISNLEVGGAEPAEAQMMLGL